jgi:hypothetical protein
MEEMERRFEEERYSCLARRVDDIEKRQQDMQELINSVGLLAQRMGTVEGNVSEMRGDLRTLMEKPGKRWDSVVEKTLLVVVGAVVAWIMTKLGL